MTIRLDRPVRVAGTDLEPGLYQLVLIEREGGRGEVCFIAGSKMRARKIAAVAPVEILKERLDLIAVPILRENGDGIAAIAEIRLPSKTLRFEEPGIPANGRDPGKMRWRKKTAVRAGPNWRPPSKH